MYREYGDRVAFLFVYVQEAHPSDGWQMDANVKEGVIFGSTRTLQDRCNVAGQCCDTLALTLPCVVDTIDESVDNMYAGWPERLYVVTPDGRVAYAGGRGPFGYKPEEVKCWLKNNVGRR